MTDDKKWKPGVAFWATVVVVVALLYPISFGPACWITSRMNFGASAVPIFYRPAIWSMAHDTGVAKAITSYSELGAAKDWHWVGFGDSSIEERSFVWMHVSAPRMESL
jgi:hypothetical protein